MSIPVTILGSTVLWPTQGDTNYSAGTTQFVQLVSTALAPISGLYNNTTGHVGNLAINNSDQLTLNGVPVGLSGVLSFNTRTGAVTLTSLDVTTALGYTPGSGSVTSVGVSGANGIGVSGSPITSTGTIALSLGNITPSSVSTAGNLNFTGSAQRITGLFSGNPISDRVMFQTSTANAATSIGAIPNGSSSVASFSLENSSTPLNNGQLNVQINASNAIITSTVRGSGTQLPLIIGTTATPSAITISTTNNVSMGGTLSVTGNITGANLSGTNTGDQTLNSLLPTQSGHSGQFLTTNGTNASWGTAGAGSVTSVSVAGTSGRITSSGSPITSSGTITVDLATTAVTPGSYTALNGTVDAYGRLTAASNGVVGDRYLTTSSTSNSIGTGSKSFTIGTGLSYSPLQDVIITENGSPTTNYLSGSVTSYNSGSGALVANITNVGGSGTFSAWTVNVAGAPAGNGLPSGGTTGQVLSKISNTSYDVTWTTPTTGTVTSVGVSGANGIGVASSPITTSGTIALSLGNITPTTVSTGAITSSANLNFTGTGNRITGLFSGTTVADRIYVQTSTANTATTFGVIPNGTATTAAISLDGDSSPLNNSQLSIQITSSAAIITSSARGTGTVRPLLLGTGATPGNGITVSTANNVSMGGTLAVTSTITGSNLTGTNTGDQTITLTGDVTGSGTSSFATTLANTAVIPGSYTNVSLTVDSKGRITAASSGTPAFVAPNYEEFVATSSQTVFNTTLTTTAKGAGKAYLQVYVNGVFQQEGATKKYQVTGANQITFNTGLVLNDDVAIFGYA